MKAQINGTEIFFDVEGTGLKVTPTALVEKPICAIIHGGPGGDHSTYRPWLSPLAESLQLIYVDHRGTGRSGKVPFETCTIENFADDLDELRKILGIDKWIVLGCSFGGMWGLTYAIRHQKSLTHLILLDTTASWKENWPETQKMAEKMGTPAQRRVYSYPFEGKIGTEDESKKWYEIMLPLYFHHYNKRIGNEFIARGKGSPATAQYMWKNIMPDYDVTDKLSSIHVPTLVMAGKHDWVTPYSQAVRIAKGIPNAKLVTFQKSGHIVYIEEQKKFIRSVLNFLRKPKE